MLFYKICGTLSKFEEPYQSSRWVDVDCVWKWLFWLSVRFQTNASTFFCQHPCKELLQSWAAPQLRSIGENVNMWLDPDWPCLVKDLQLQSPVLISMILAHRLVFMFSPMSSRKKTFILWFSWAGRIGLCTVVWRTAVSKERTAASRECQNDQTSHVQKHLQATSWMGEQRMDKRSQTSQP